MKGCGPPGLPSPSLLSAAPDMVHSTGNDHRRNTREPAALILPGGPPRSAAGPAPGGRCCDDRRLLRPRRAPLSVRLWAGAGISGTHRLRDTLASPATTLPALAR